MKYLFVVNPKSGTSRKEKIVRTIRKIMKSASYQIIYWEHAEQDIKKIIQQKRNDYDVVVAVGGDGTVNTVAQALINSNTSLGIIPCGSGNGLAHYLGIPANPKKAIELLQQGKIITIDTCSINKQEFVSTCGVGFDAEVSAEFAHSSRRGFLSYAAIIFKNMWRYDLEDYEIIIDGKMIQRTALLVTVANSNQYGNNVIIAPHADIQDGIMEVIIVNPFPLYKVFSMCLKLFTKSIHHSRFVETFQAESVKLIRGKQGFVHYDGEPIKMDQEIDIDIRSKSLKVLCA